MAAGCSSGSSDRKRAASSSSTAPVETSATAAESSTSSTDLSTTSSSVAAATVTTNTTAKPAATTSPPTGNRMAASGAFIVGAGGAAVSSEPGGRVLRRLRAGVIMGVDAIDGGWAHVLSPCENSLWVKTAEGRIEQTADIVIDPGHGGGESGAVGSGGLTEKELNCAVAQMAVEALSAEGVHAVLARSGDY